MRGSLAAVVTLLAALGASAAHAVLLDPTFGVGGKVTDAALGGARDFLLEPSGRLIVLADPKAEDSGTVLSAYLPDGTLDASFGTGGRAVVTSSVTFWAHIARQPADGKLLVVYYPYSLRRFESNGQPDTSFGTGGVVVLDQTLRFPEAIVVQPDGKIVIAGEGWDDDGVLRLLPDGTPDPTFGTGGIVLTATTLDEGLRPYTLALGPDGKIAVGGYYRFVPDPDRAVIQYLNDGTPDPDFGTNGLVVTDLSGGFEYLSSLVYQADGKMIAFGPFSGFVSGSYSSMVAVRYLADGTLDGAYGTGGIAAVDHSFDRDPAIPRAILDDDGKVLVTAGAMLARFTDTGLLDRTLAPCAVAMNPLNDGFDIGVVRRTDGKLLVVGGIRPRGEFGFLPSTFGIVRYTDDDPACQPAGPRLSRLSARPARGRTFFQKLKWKWRSSVPVALADFGPPPPGDRFFACILDADPLALRNGSLFDLTGFSVSSFGYKGRVEELSGRLHPGVAGKASIYFSDLLLNPDALYVPPVTVRLDRNGATCWEAQFSVLKKNSDVAFSATSD